MKSIFRSLSIGVVVFVVSVIGILVARGILDKSDLPTKEKIRRELSHLSKLPLIGRFAPKLTTDVKNPLLIDDVANIDTYVKLRPFSSAEIAAFVSQLKERATAYEERAKMLGEKERRLEFLQDDISEQKREIELLKQNLVEIRQSIEKERKALDGRFVELKGSEKKNLKSIAEKYQTMKPDVAAKIMKDLNEETAIKLLALMEERQAGKILASLDDPGLAADLIEKMKGLTEDGS